MMKVMIADDQELMRESLKILLSSKADIEIVALAHDGRDVLALIPQHKPDVILMDIRMPVMDGVMCTKEVKKRYPDIQIIVLTTFNDDEYIYDALTYGASSYLLKGVSLDELYSAIQTVLQGGGIIHPDVAIKAMKMFSNMAKNQMELADEEIQLQSFSKTEWKIIEKIGQGLSNKEIAEELSFTEGTVRNYLSIILEKIGLRDRTQLAIWAVHQQKQVHKGAAS